MQQPLPLQLPQRRRGCRSQRSAPTLATAVIRVLRPALALLPMRLPELPLVPLLLPMLLRLSLSR